MLSKKQIKFILNLTQRKYREASGCFVVEGPKSVLDLVAAGMELKECYTLKLLDELPPMVQIVINSSELKAMSSLTTPQNLIGVFKIPKMTRSLLIYFSPRLIADYFSSSPMPESPDKNRRVAKRAAPSGSSGLRAIISSRTENATPPIETVT